MNTISVFVGVDEFICKQFDGGIDIWEKNIFLGELEGVNIPDAEDNDELENFNKEVENWLEVNYYNSKSIDY